MTPFLSKQCLPSVFSETLKRPEASWMYNHIMGTCIWKLYLVGSTPLCHWNCMECILEQSLIQYIICLIHLIHIITCLRGFWIEFSNATLPRFILEPLLLSIYLNDTFLDPGMRGAHIRIVWDIVRLFFTHYRMVTSSCNDELDS